MGPSNVAKVFKARQYAAGMTQLQYAEKLGVAQSTLSQIYSGVRNPAREVIHAFLRVFPEAATELGHAQLADAREPRPAVVAQEAVA